MKVSVKSLALGLAQLLLVSATGGKMLYDRATLPRVWVKTVPYDPNVPIRGRYLSLSLEVENPAHYGQSNVDLEIEGDHLVARPSHFNSTNYLSRQIGDKAIIFPPLAFFINDQAADPSSHLLPDQELWVEVSVAPRSHPRPIRLGIKHNGVLTPLS